MVDTQQCLGDDRYVGRKLHELVYDQGDEDRRKARLAYPDVARLVLCPDVTTTIWED